MKPQVKSTASSMHRILEGNYTILNIEEMFQLIIMLAGAGMTNYFFSINLDNKPNSVHYANINTEIVIIKRLFMIPQFFWTPCSAICVTSAIESRYFGKSNRKAIHHQHIESFRRTRINKFLNQQKIPYAQLNVPTIDMWKDFAICFWRFFFFNF